MKKIVEYSVIVGHSTENLVYCVNNAIKKGWEPFGGVNSDISGKRQAMVKYEIIHIVPEDEPLLDATYLDGKNYKF